MILAIETATPVCSVALQLEDGSVVEERQEGKGIHSEKMFVFIDRLLTAHTFGLHRLDEILFGNGPGQYTGLRIGAAGIKGLLFGKKIPLLVLGTLEGFAAGVVGTGKKTGTIHSVLDARREHLYHQEFRFDERTLQAGPAVIDEIAAIDGKLKKGDRITGTGLERLARFGSPGMTFYDRSRISARNLITARTDPRFKDRFQRIDPEQFEPEYLTTGN